MEMGETAEPRVCAYCGVRIRFPETMVERGPDVYCCLNCAVEDRGSEQEAMAGSPADLGQRPTVEETEA